MFLNCLINSMCLSGYVAKDWRGGRIVDRWKSTCSARDCNTSRNLLLADHSMKVLTGLFQDDVEEFAIHTTRAFTDWCRSMGRSLFILFVDLTKAFDLVIR